MSAADECYVDVRSYGCNDGIFKGGHIRVNWTMAQTITTTGIYLALVDPITCTGRPFPPVNTASGGAAAAGVLINYLNIVSRGQVRVLYVEYIMHKAQYTPPAPTRLNCGVESRRRCARNSQLVGDSLDESEQICQQRSRVVSRWRYERTRRQS